MGADIVLDAKGEIANPPICLYTLANGHIYFSESARLDKETDEWIFDLEETAIVKIMKDMTPTQEVEIKLMGVKIRGSEVVAPFTSRVRRIHRLNVLFRDDCADAKVLTALRNMVSKVKSLIV